jgi:D-threo-aldose 1-dehydrogenase
MTMTERTLKSALLTDDLPVSALGFGAAEIGNLYRAQSDEEAQATLLAAAQAGMTLFDTAPFYGHGLSEMRLGQFLRNRPRDSFVLSTKVGRYMTAPGGPLPWSPFAAPLPFLPVFDYSYDGTMRALEQSRMRLGVPRLDVVFVHDLDRNNHGAAFDAQFRTAVAGCFKALSELRRAGEIGAIGIGVNEGDVGAMMLAEGDFDCALLAGRYTLLDQSGLEVFLPTCVAKGVKVLMGGIFNSGILASGAVPGAVYNYGPAPEPVIQRVRVLEAICTRHGVPLAAAALQFAAAHPAAISVLVGASRPDNVDRAVRTFHAPVNAALWREIAESGLIATGAPLPA